MDRDRNCILCNVVPRHKPLLTPPFCSHFPTLYSLHQEIKVGILQCLWKNIGQVQVDLAQLVFHSAIHAITASSSRFLVLRNKGAIIKVGCLDVFIALSLHLLYFYKYCNCIVYDVKPQDIRLNWNTLIPEIATTLCGFYCNYYVNEFAFITGISLSGSLTAAITNR